MNNIKVTILNSDPFFGICTYSREHGKHGRFLVFKDKIKSLILDPSHKMFIDTDCGRYLECRYDKETQYVWFKVVWLNYNCDNTVYGFCEDFCIPSAVFFQVDSLAYGKCAKLLHSNNRELTRICIANQTELNHILSDKKLKRAFVKAISHHFQWGGGTVTLYPDSHSGNFDFYEETYRGAGIHGGMILTDGFRRSHTDNTRYPMQYYAVHT